MAVNPQISFTITLRPSVTVEQYAALLNVISEGASAYQALILNITTNNIAPTLVRVPISVTADGMADPDVRAAIQTALDNLKIQNPSITWQFVDAS